MITEKTERVYSFDLLRILANCAVVMLHTSAIYISDFGSGSVEFAWGNVFSSLSRFAVPVFLMISGALMLDEKKVMSTGKVMRSTVNILLLTVSWSAVYALVYDIVKPFLLHGTVSLSSAFNTIVNGYYHMWYLQALVGLYLVTPLLRTFIKKENALLIRNYLLFSVAICFLIPFMNYGISKLGVQRNLLAEIMTKYPLTYVYDYLVYYVLGWYIAHVGMEKRSRYAVYIGGLLGLAATYVGTRLFFAPGVDEYFLANNSLNIFLYSFAVFTFVYNSFRNRKLNAFGVKLSGLTFGVYLIHCIYLSFFNVICRRFDSAPLGIFTLFTGTVLLSFLSVFVMSRIPLLKKLVRG